ncbi:MAG: helix-turn-helix transcriptional regulator [Chitinivibrionia bacterium]|nr:helix-turn-helix transcriptional regulator [Chitinivibrionia bacterium]
MKPRQEIRNHLRHYRLMADGMTQQDLADRVEVTRQTIVSIEKGNYNPTVVLALRIAHVFGISVETLFELEKGERDDRD